MAPSDAPVVVEQPTTEAEAAAAVEIAEIQADAAVEINQANAGAAVAIAEADAAEDEEWQFVKGVLDALQTRCATNEADLSSAQTEIALLKAELIAVREDLTAMTALTRAAAGAAAAAAEASPSPNPENSLETSEAAMTAEAETVAAETAAAADTAEQHAQAQEEHARRKRRYLR